MGSGTNSNTLLITGGAGFMGSNFTHYWRCRHEEDIIIVLDSLTYSGNLHSIEPLLEEPFCNFVRGDICDPHLVQDLLRENNVNLIIHFAAETHVDRSIVDPGVFIQTNVVGTYNLLEGARRVWLEDRESDTEVRFHHISTDEVFGSLEPDEAAFQEHSPYAPNSPYAASKAGSDHLVRAYHNTYGLPTVITNSSNNYGPYQYPEKLIPLTIINALEGRILPVYGDGLNRRDWLYVEDHCRGIELAINNGALGSRYNLGGGNEITNISLVESICEAIDERFEENYDLHARFPNAAKANGASSRDLIRFVRDRPGHDRRYAIDATRISTELAFQTRATLESGLGKTIKWYLDNEGWWRPLLDRKYWNWQIDQYGEGARR
jgi:dTDP-glucose 4,6-dehydratase